MKDVMKGVRVLEVAQYTFVPSAGAVLADWGADVIKVEKLTGPPIAGSSILSTLNPASKAYTDIQRETE